MRPIVPHYALTTDPCPAEEFYDPAKHRPEEISKIGSIRVKFYRARRSPKNKPYVASREPPQSFDELPECVLKGRDIKANTKYVPLKRVVLFVIDTA